QTLTLLLAPELANEFGTAAQDLGTKLAQVDARAVPSAAVATAFTELGRVLIAAKAEKDASTAALKADPAMQKIFTEMGAAIGTDTGHGLRSLAFEHWRLRMAGQQLEFLRAKDNSSGRRAVVLAYIDLRDKRDAEDLQLGSLRQSLLDLATAHSALARGSA